MTKWELIAKHSRLIYTLSERNRNRIRSQESFENDCFVRIAYIYDNQMHKGWRNIDGLIRRSIYRLLLQQIDRERKWRRGYTIEEGTENSEDVDLIERIPDDGASVDSDLMAKEKIARLAADDLRKVAILNDWASGYTNDSELAARMSAELGGSRETHRTYIRRFRDRCKVVIRTEFAS